MKRECIRKCLSHNNLSLLFLFKTILIIIFFNIKPTLASEECKTDPFIKIGLLENDYIDYQYYLYYELGNFAQENNIEFNINFVENNIDDFDIVFGEWDKLAKLTLNKISLPNEVKEFYEEHNIEVKENILPLDLDTFIVLNDENYTLKNLEEFSNISSPIKYTFGMNFNKSDDLLRIISFSSHKNFQFIESHTIESILNSFKKLYKNSNKNILHANFLEIYTSYENKENLFTLFNDGILLYKNLPASSFNLFPQSEYIWNEDLGVFKKNQDLIPYSFYGFSSYVNNTNQIGLLCHFVKKEVRENTFRNFNIQISPLSINEINNFKNLPIEYQEIVKLKNKNIISNVGKPINKNLDIIRDIIFGNKDYEASIKNKSYLNY